MQMMCELMNHLIFQTIELNASSSLVNRRLLQTRIDAADVQIVWRYQLTYGERSDVRATQTRCAFIRFSSRPNETIFHEADLFMRSLLSFSHLLDVMLNHFASTSAFASHFPLRCASETSLVLLLQRRATFWATLSIGKQP